MQKMQKGRVRRPLVGVLALAVLLAFGAASAWAAGMPTAPAPVTPLEEAKAIALQHARLEEEDVTLTRLATDRDDGRLEYEVEFISGGMAYDYEIDAETKEVLKYASEKPGEKWCDIENGAYLGLEKAEELALAAAGLDAEQATLTEIQFDFDDRHAMYEVEFTADGKEYQIDLDAATGEVLKQETELRKDKNKR